MKHIIRNMYLYLLINEMNSNVKEIYIHILKFNKRFADVPYLKDWIRFGFTGRFYGYQKPEELFNKYRNNKPKI